MKNHRQANGSILHVINTLQAHKNLQHECVLCNRNSTIFQKMINVIRRSSMVTYPHREGLREVSLIDANPRGNSHRLLQIIINPDNLPHSCAPFIVVYNPEASKHRIVRSKVTSHREQIRYVVLRTP